MWPFWTTAIDALGAPDAARIDVTALSMRERCDSGSDCANPAVLTIANTKRVAMRRRRQHQRLKKLFDIMRIISGGRFANTVDD
jgi:hypothetical protein